MIPIYNHGRLLQHSIAQILAYKIPLFIINDGSVDETWKILRKIAQENQQIKIYHLPFNQGKGAALLFGFKKVMKKKFSHILQIDADNQHNIADIKLFLELAKKNPKSVINGCPLYDKNVPKSRYYGRKITNFWVKIETLSNKIQDAMCGFRVYPALSLNNINLATINKRMGFDIEIIVRLFWNKVEIINQETLVNYPPDGTSNFKVIQDNLRISLVHAKLFLGMIWRLPQLIKR